jgi:hypothetical protein
MNNREQHALTGASAIGKAFRINGNMSPWKVWLSESSIRGTRAVIGVR